MKPGLFHARVAASTEMAAGIGLALGLLTPVPAAGSRGTTRQKPPKPRNYCRRTN